MCVHFCSLHGTDGISRLLLLQRGAHAPAVFLIPGALRYATRDTAKSEKLKKNKADFCKEKIIIVIIVNIYQVNYRLFTVFFIFYNNNFFT